MKKGYLWVIHENFPLLEKNLEFSKSISLLNEIKFFSGKWYKGMFSNFKYVGLVNPYKFPHAVFFPNMQNNHYAINETFILNVPSWGLVDTLDNPSNIFFPIPGNSKSLSSLFFFYSLVSKIAIYSRHAAASSFIFRSYKKAKLIFNNRGMRLSDSVFYFQEFFSTYQDFIKKMFLIENCLFLLRPSKLKKDFKFLFLRKKKIKYSRKSYLLR